VLVQEPVLVLVQAWESELVWVLVQEPVLVLVQAWESELVWVLVQEPVLVLVQAWESELVWVLVQEPVLVLVLVLALQPHPAKSPQAQGLPDQPQCRDPCGRPRGTPPPAERAPHALPDSCCTA
jgi:hypothetical protein